MRSAITAGPDFSRVADLPESKPSLAQRSFVRWVLLLIPTAVVLGPTASYPLHSGGFFTLYRLLYLPLAVCCFLIWRQRGGPRFIGSRALLVFIALLALVGTLDTLSPNITSRGTTDHYILVSSLVIAWLVAAAASCDSDARNTLLTGWYVGFMIAAALALMHAAGIFAPQTTIGLFTEAYAATGRQIGFSGTLGNPNDLAAFALATAPIAYLAAKRWERPWLTRLVIIAALAMGLVSLSRAALLGLLLLPLAFVALRRSRQPGRLPVLFVVSTYLVLLLLTISASQIGERLLNVPFLGSIASEIQTVGFQDQSRIITWTEILQQSLSVNPWGFGPGQYEVLAESSLKPLLPNPHNVFLEVMMEYGVFAALAGLVWIGIIIVNSWRRASHAASDWDNLVVSAGATALLGLIVWGSLTSTLITRPSWALILGTGIALVSSVAAPAQRGR